jgi:hypothetical protein
MFEVQVDVAQRGNDDRKIKSSRPKEMQCLCYHRVCRFLLLSSALYIFTIGVGSIVSENPGWGYQSKPALVVGVHYLTFSLIITISVVNNHALDIVRRKTPLLEGL